VQVRSASDIREVRASVRDVCGAHGMDHDRCADAQLAVSELVGNALRHGTPPIDVEVRWRDGHVLLSVADEAAALPQPRQAVSAGAESGRGLQLVAAVAAAWGCEPYGHGKRVWARL
jgi:anti-sigma regulatory factor (Ser/Thr protein kinase)